MSHAPPIGIGVYARNQSATWLAQFDFVAVNATRADAERVARELIALGVSVWFYSTPGEWFPGTWEPEVQRLTLLCEATGAKGFIADPEMQWGSATDAECEALGVALGEAADRGLSIGITSHAGLPQRVYDSWNRGAKGKCWGSPQLYAHERFDAARERGIEAAQQLLDSWARKFHSFPSTIVSCSGWPGRSNLLGTPEGYRDYLDCLPRSAAYIAWLPTGTPTEWRMEILSEYSPGGLGGLGTILEAIRNGIRSGDPAYIGGLVALASVLFVTLLAGLVKR